jgi:hypothetical protein
VRGSIHLSFPATLDLCIYASCPLIVSDVTYTLGECPSTLSGECFVLLRAVGTRVLTNILNNMKRTRIFICKECFMFRDQLSRQFLGTELIPIAFPLRLVA